jgi:hypothetical protein
MGCISDTNPTIRDPAGNGPSPPTHRNVPASLREHRTGRRLIRSFRRCWFRGVKMKGGPQDSKCARDPTHHPEAPLPLAAAQPADADGADANRQRALHLTGA